MRYELRHVWQIKNAEHYYMNGYKKSSECQNMEEYNLQPAEIDAHAFGAAIMMDFYHLKPLMNGMSDLIKSKVYERADELLREIEE